MLAENKGTQKKNLHEAMNQSTFKPSVASTALFPFNQSWKKNLFHSSVPKVSSPGKTLIELQL